MAESTFQLHYRYQALVWWHHDAVRQRYASAPGPDKRWTSASSTSRARRRYRPSTRASTTCSWRTRARHRHFRSVPAPSESVTWCSHLVTKSRQRLHFMIPASNAFCSDFKVHYMFILVFKQLKRMLASAFIFQGSWTIHIFLQFIVSLISDWMWWCDGTRRRVGTERRQRHNARLSLW